MMEVVFCPVESGPEGYYLIPGYPRHCINEFGRVRDLTTNSFVSVSKRSSYIYVSIFNESIDKVHSVGVHRLAALAFLGPPKFNNAIPNHLDGVKTNNCFENIEWSTYGGNIDHAYRNGLRTDNTPILAKDLRDDTITRFHAMAECARFFGVNTERIWRNVRDTSGNIYFDHFIFKFEDDLTPWPELTNKDIGKHNNGESKGTLALCLLSGREIQAPSMSKMAILTNVKLGTIAYAIRTGKQYPVQGHLFKRVDDLTPWATLPAAA